MIENIAKSGVWVPIPLPLDEEQQALNQSENGSKLQALKKECNKYLERRMSQVFQDNFKHRHLVQNYVTKEAQDS